MKAPWIFGLAVLLFAVLALSTGAQDRNRTFKKPTPTPTPTPKQLPPNKDLPGNGGGGLTLDKEGNPTPPPPKLEKGGPPRPLPPRGQENAGGGTHAQPTNFEKDVTLEIVEVTKDDAKATPSRNPHERLVPVLLKWKGKSVNQGKLLELEALLETVNTDGTKSRVTKKIIDFSVNKLLAETIILPMKEGTFARDFKLTLSGKCASGEGAKRLVVAISTVKQGSFPGPNLSKK